MVQVPQQSRLLGYEQQTIPLAGVYVSPDVPRDLRIGAKVIFLYHVYSLHDLLVVL